MNAKYLIVNGLDSVEVEADALVLKAPDGTEIKLTYRKTDGKISLYANRQLLITPRAANTLYLNTVKD